MIIGHNAGHYCHFMVLCSVHSDTGRKFSSSSTRNRSSHNQHFTSSMIMCTAVLQGMKSTLLVMDQECPRQQGSISNRQVLMKELHLEKLMKQNKVCAEGEVFFVCFINLCVRMLQYETESVCCISDV